MKNNVRVIDCTEDGKTVIVTYKSGTVRYYLDTTMPENVRNILRNVLNDPNKYECGIVTVPHISGDARTGLKFSVKKYARVIVC